MKNNIKVLGDKKKEKRGRPKGSKNKFNKSTDFLINELKREKRKNTILTKELIISKNKLFLYENNKIINFLKSIVGY